jgi:5,6,7,8-tetrahydromethanopterin hydro-lyase
MAPSLTPSRLAPSFRTQIGEAFVGEGAHAAHLNTVLGERGGPIETAWATALATPRQGHIPFLTTLRPGVATKPPTLFVNKAPLEGELHSRLTWGAAQAGVASGVMGAVTDRTLNQEALDDLLLIACVWVDPAASDEELVFENNRDATRLALLAGARRSPTTKEALAAAAEPFNAFFRMRA